MPASLLIGTNGKVWCMKHVCAFLICGLAVCLMGGCRRPATGSTGNVKVTVEGQQRFPASLSGRWKADRHGWELVLETNGRIASAVIPFGRVQVVPGRTTTTPTRSGDQAIFTPGPWAVHYDPTTRELTVKIVMEHVRVPMADNVVEGSSTDILAGLISPEEDTWQAQWTTYTRYIAATGEGKPVDLSTDSTYGETQPLTFTRVVNQAP